MDDDAKFSAEFVKCTLEKHLTLGREKAVSYLPIRTVEKVIGLSIPAYIAMIEKSGNSHATFGPEDCTIGSGAIYAFSAPALEDILKQNSSILSENGWPIDSDNFIRRIASDWLDEEHPVTPVIRKAFGDLF